LLWRGKEAALGPPLLSRARAIVVTRRSFFPSVDVYSALRERAGRRRCRPLRVVIPVRQRRPEVRAQVLTVHISLPDVEELQKLVETGKEKGFLTYDEIVTGLEEVELSKEQLEDFTTYLIDHGIELVEGEQHRTLPHEQPLAEEEKSSPKLDLTVEP